MSFKFIFVYFSSVSVRQLPADLSDSIYLLVLVAELHGRDLLVLPNEPQRVPTAQDFALCFISSLWLPKQAYWRLVICVLICTPHLFPPFTKEPKVFASYTASHSSSCNHIWFQTRRPVTKWIPVVLKVMPQCMFKGWNVLLAKQKYIMFLLFSLCFGQGRDEVEILKTLLTCSKTLKVLYKHLSLCTTLLKLPCVSPWNI